MNKYVEVYRLESHATDKPFYYVVDDKTDKAKRISEDEYMTMQSKAIRVECIYSVYNGNKNIKHYRTLVF